MRFYSYPYKEISINSAFLEIPAEYQRKLQMGKVKQMVAEFNGVIVNPPKVSYRDGRYIVIDGRHTIVGLKTLNGGNDLPILCRVYVGLTKEEEALVFAQQTGASTPLSAGAKLGRVQRTKQAKRSRGYGLPFASPLFGKRKAGRSRRGTSCHPYTAFLSWVRPSGRTLFILKIKFQIKS